MKKLNKPPISKEQQALEEYVASLLAETSNVLPISRARKKKDKLISVPARQALQNEAENVEVIQQAEKREQLPERNPATPAQSGAEAAKSSSMSDGRTSSESLKEKSEAASSDDCFSNAESEESEAEALAKWNALLESDSNPLQEAASIIESNSEDASNHNHSNHSATNASELKRETYLNKRTETSATTEAEQKPDSSHTPKETTKIEARTGVEALPQEPTFADPRLAGVQKLLAKMTVARLRQVDTATKITTAETGNTETQEQTAPAMSEDAVAATFAQREPVKSRDILPDVFQTLIFNVGKLPLAVPLLKLGGIIKFSPQEVTPLVGTPNWFMGLLPSDRGNLMVIDSQQFLMPDKAAVEPCADNYEYVIQLDDSQWALACNSVGDAKNLTLEDVRWSARSSQRPWFAGMVVDYMSALIEVDELINMLAQHVTE